MTINGVNHITLAVTDLDRSICFYRELLGLMLRARWPEGAYFETGSLWLCLSVDANAARVERSDYTHIALNVSAEHFETTAARVAEGAKLWRQNRSEGPSLYFLDPDGHKLELHAGSLASRLAHYRTNPPPGMTLFDLARAAPEHHE